MISNNPWLFKRDLWDETKTIRENAEIQKIPYFKTLTYCKHLGLKYKILHQSAKRLRQDNKESNSLWEGED